MSTLWQNLRRRFDLSKHPKWGWRMSVLYGMGVWTMLGVLCLKWMKGGDAIQAAHFGVTTETFKNLSQEERDQLITNKKIAILERQQELAEHVAENVYKPVDFMG